MPELMLRGLCAAEAMSGSGSSANCELPSPFEMRILVADDNADCVASLSMLLEAEGQSISTASDGQEAVELASAGNPDAVILDIGLPGLMALPPPGRSAKRSPAPFWRPTRATPARSSGDEPWRQVSIITSASMKPVPCCACSHRTSPAQAMPPSDSPALENQFNLGYVQRLMSGRVLI